MDNLLKQMSSVRVRFYGAEEEKKEEKGSSRDRRLASQKSQSFKEKKTTQNWFSRQFSGQMSRGYGSDNEIDHITAVAAAVFAVRSIEEPEIACQKRDFKGPNTSFITRTNKEENNTRITDQNPVPEPSKVSRRRLSDEDLSKETEASDRKVAVISEPEKEKPKEALADKKLDRSDRKKPESAAVKPPPPPPTPHPSIKKPDRSDRKKPESAATKPPPPPPTPHPSIKKPPSEPFEIKKPVQPVPTSLSGAREIEAEAWERAEMAKIKEKYEKVNDTISYWENKKREKARRKLELAQGVGVDRRKTERARKKYEEDLEFIRQIAGEARAKAVERRKNDVLKAKQKAETIRKTGELPVTCFCC